MSKRYVKVPESLFVTDLNGKQVVVQENQEIPAYPLTYSMEQFIHHLLNDEKFSTTGPQIRMAVRIENAFKDKKENEFVELKEEDWKVLQEVAENPKQGYPGISDGNGKLLFSISRQLVSFLEALENPPNKL